MLDYQKSLDKVAVLCTCELPDEDREHVLNVIFALKKQIQEQVRLIRITDKLTVYHCPSCGECIACYGFNFCPQCGQALTW